MRINYTHLLWILAVCLIVGTFLFKFKTGSFISISQESLKEVRKYEIEKRKHELTIPSLKASTFDMRTTYEDVMLDIANTEQSACLLFLKEELNQLSYDSAFLRIMQEIYEQAVFFDMVESKDGLQTYAFHDEKNACNEPVVIEFKRNEQNEQLINSITNLGNYLNCACEPE